MAEFYYNGEVYEMMAWANTTDQEVEEFLRDAQNGNISAISALGRLKIKSALPILISNLKHENPDVRMDSAQAIGKIGDLEAVRNLVALLKDPDADVREYVLSAFADIRDQQFVPDIIPLINDPHRFVRCAVAETLGILEDGRSASSLIYLLNDEDPGVIAAAIEALGNIQAKNAVEFLRPYLLHVSLEVQFSAMYSLAILESNKYIDELLSYLTQENRKIKVLMALGRIKNGSSFQALIKSLKEKDSRVRYTAVRSLIEHKNLDSLPHLLESLKDDSYSVRENALEGIELMGSQQTFRTLLNHEYFRAREVAEKKLNVVKHLHPEKKIHNNLNPDSSGKASFNFNIIFETDLNQDE